MSRRKNKKTFSWEGLGILLGILFLPLMVIARLIKLDERDRKRRGRHQGVMRR